MIRVDNLVIGSGAGGSTVFHALAEAGEEVTLVEEGPEVDFSSSSKSVPERMVSLYRKAGIQPILSQSSFAFAEGRVFGGTTELNGGLFWRTPDKVLDDWQRNHNLFSDLTPNTLEELWRTLERDMRVEIQPTQDGFDLDSLKLKEGAERLGLSAFPVPRAGAHACKRSNLCAAGCPIKAKGSMSQTLLPRARAAGGKVLTNSRVESLRRRGGEISEVLIRDLSSGKFEEVRAKRYFLAAGALQSPRLLSTATSMRKFSIGFHANAKIVARFPDKIMADRGTIFTRQIQDFLDEGILIMPSPVSAGFLGLALGGMDPERFSDLVRDMSHHGIFTVQFRPHSYGHLLASNCGVQPVHRFQEIDFHLFRKGIRVAAKVLFASGASMLTLPFRDYPTAVNLLEVEHILNRVRKSDWLLSSVHAMASLRAGKRSSSLVREDGRLKKLDNLWVVDSSALPTLVGESPQGTIMAWARLASRHILNQ